MTTVWPAARPLTLLTLTFVSPGLAGAASVAGAGDARKTIESLFSSTAFAVETLPTSQPGRAQGTDGAGVVGLGAGAVEVAGLRARDGRGGAGARGGDAAGCHCRERERNRDRACDLEAFAHALLLLFDRETLRVSDLKWESDIWQSCVG